MRDEPLLLSKGRECVVHVQLPSGRQLQCAVVGRAAWDVDVVLVVWPLALWLGVPGSPGGVGTCSLLQSCLVFWEKNRSINNSIECVWGGCVSARTYSDDLNKMD